MAADRTEDLEALNAFVDGELTPDAHARMAARIASDPALARAHATLAQLRAGLAGYADATPPPRIETRPRRNPWPAAAAATLAALLAGASFVQWSVTHPAPRHLDAALDYGAVRPVSFDSRPMVPDLSAAGLTLVRVDGEAGRPLDHLVAVYTGPRGCRLELHVRPHGSAPIVAPQSTHRHQWSDSAADYELLAFGMPSSRFAMVADAAERQTRALAGPNPERLREARRNAPPCVG